MGREPGDLIEPPSCVGGRSVPETKDKNASAKLRDAVVRCVEQANHHTVLRRPGRPKSVDNVPQVCRVSRGRQTRDVLKEEDLGLNNPNDFVEVPQ